MKPPMEDSLADARISRSSARPALQEVCRGLRSDAFLRQEPCEAYFSDDGRNRSRVQARPVSRECLSISPRKMGFPRAEARAGKPGFVGSTSRLCCGANSEHTTVWHFQSGCNGRSSATRVARSLVDEAWRKMEAQLFAKNADARTSSRLTTTPRPRDGDFVEHMNQACAHPGRMPPSPQGRMVGEVPLTCWTDLPNDTKDYLVWRCIACHHLWPRFSSIP